MAETATWHRDLSIDQQLALRTAVTRLAGEFTGLYGSETIERFLHTSYGSEPDTAINPSAIAAMTERGIDISGEYPKPWTDEIVRAADVVITMGCGDACPIFPSTRYEDWQVDDPAGQSLADVRPIRDEIERRVRHLLDELDVPTQ